MARRAVVIQADVRDAPARLLADDIVQARVGAGGRARDEAALTQRRTETEAKLARPASSEAELEDGTARTRRRCRPRRTPGTSCPAAASGSRAPRGSPRTRIRPERRGRGAAPGRDPDELEREAARVRETEAQIEAEVEDQALLAEAVERRQQLESQQAEEERRISALIRAAADRREGLARLTGQVNALKSRAAAAESEIGRLTSACDEAEVRAAQAQDEFTALETQVAGLDADGQGSTTRTQAAQAVLDEMDERLAKLRARSATPSVSAPLWPRARKPWSSA